MGPTNPTTTTTTTTTPPSQAHNANSIFLSKYKRPWDFLPRWLDYSLVWFLTEGPEQKVKEVGQPESSFCSLAPGPNLWEAGLILLIPILMHSPQALIDLFPLLLPNSPFSTQQPTCTSDLSILLLIIIYLLPIELTVASKIWKIWTYPPLIFYHSLLYSPQSIHKAFLPQLSPSPEIFLPLTQLFTQMARWSCASPVSARPSMATLNNTPITLWLIALIFYSSNQSLY